MPTDSVIVMTMGTNAYERTQSRQCHRLSLLSCESFQMLPRAFFSSLGCGDWLSDVRSWRISALANTNGTCGTVVERRRWCTNANVVGLGARPVHKRRADFAQDELTRIHAEVGCIVVDRDE